MINLPIYDREGLLIEELQVDEAALGGSVRASLLRQAVQMHEARQRVGTVNKKGRSQVAGSGRKLWRQKGTGRARVGAGKVNIWRGGGMAFPPKNRDYGYSMPKKSRRLATRSALLARLQDGVVRVILELKLEQPRTKMVATMLRVLDAARPCLLVTKGDDVNTWKSSRNISGLRLVRASDANAYDLLRAEQIIFTREAFNAFMQRLQ